MVDDEKDRQLDAMLDSLLRAYSAADPRPGYETRLRAVVNARIIRARRADWLMIAASAAAVVLFAWIMISRTHTTRATPERVAVNQSAPSVPATVASAVTATPAAVKPAISVRAGNREFKVSKSVESRLVLQMAEAAHGTDMVFEHEKLYLTPETLPEPAATTPAADQGQAQIQAATPSVSIQDVGVASIESNAPIEIKDLAPPKSSNEKGSL